MAISQLRSKRKATGGRFKRLFVKRLSRMGRLPVFTSIGARKIKTVRTIGGNKKSKILRAEKINLYDPKAKTHTIISMKNVVENPANSQYVRRNLITKGAIVETEKGKAKITSRPGQEAVLNAVLVE
jgi:small subunit ribosomal protein S8e